MDNYLHKEIAWNNMKLVCAQINYQSFCFRNHSDISRVTRKKQTWGVKHKNLIEWSLGGSNTIKFMTTHFCFSFCTSVQKVGR